MLNRSSTSSPSANAVEDDILSALNNFVVSTPPKDSSLDSLTGESFNITGGGNSNQISTKLVKVVFITSEEIKLRCCGFIGARKNAFCLKKKQSCQSHKKNASHFNSKYSPNVNHFYIYKTTALDSAWTEFNLSHNQLMKFGEDNFNENAEQSLEDWKLTFSSLNANIEPSEIDSAINFMKHPPTYDSLKTPSKFKQLDNDIKKSESDFIFTEDKTEAEVALLFLTSSEKLEYIEASVPEELINHISDLGDILRTLFADVQSVRSDLTTRALLTDVSPDLIRISAAVTGLKSVVGTDLDGSYPDIWSAIDELKQFTEALNSTSKVLKDSNEKLDSKVSGIERVIESYGKRWHALGQNWLPLLTSHESDITQLRSEVQNISGSSNSGLSTDSILHSDPFTTSPPTSHRQFQLTLNKQADLIKELELKLTNMEIKTASMIDSSASSFHPTDHDKIDGYGSSGVSYKQYFFQDENAVKSWMKEHMSAPSHGLFVDIVSFSEFFGGDIYVERNKTLNDLYMSNKIGYATMADSIVAASFQNILPGSYGRNSSSLRTGTDTDLEAQPELPGLPTFKKWDNHDGATGRKYWIKKECRNTGIQIDGMIRAQLDKTAQYLAKELLIDAMAMSEELFNFISTSYEDTMHSGRFDTHQAWALTSKFVKRIFTEIGDARIIARDGVHVSDPWTTAAKFLFATLRAHEVMSGFMRLHIKDHPSISSEMVKFICYSQPATDTAEVLSRLSSTEVLVRTNQSNISKLEARGRKYDLWKADIDKMIKKLKEKIGLSS